MYNRLYILTLEQIFYLLYGSQLLIIIMNHEPTYLYELFLVLTYAQQICMLSRYVCFNSDKFKAYFNYSAPNFINSFHDNFSSLKQFKTKL